MVNPLLVALQGKGLSTLLKRALAIGRRYGLTMAKMDRALGTFVGILRDFDCQASFPLTAWALGRSRGDLKHYQEQGTEFAIHGYYHVDHTQLSRAQHMEQLRDAQQVFAAHGLLCTGFRAPYLRYSQETLAALDALDFSYDSSQAVAWDVVAGMETDAYRRALDFYRARPATTYLSVPRLVGDKGLVQIPYSLPDDEALVERLRPESSSELTDTQTIDKIWVKILHRTHELGELFTVGLHPERVMLCESALRAVLAQARALSSALWIARLDEIADWWRQRAAATYQVIQRSEDSFQITVNGPPGTVVLARHVLSDVQTEPWDEVYQRVACNNFVFRAQRLPLIGISPDTPETLVSFLRQQGYLVERSVEARLYTFYFDQKEFTMDNERAILMELERGTWPLLRLARWPHGARSALSITGDIDALTLWDYGLRFFVRDL